MRWLPIWSQFSATSNTHTWTRALDTQQIRHFVWTNDVPPRFEQRRLHCHKQPTPCFDPAFSSLPAADAEGLPLPLTHLRSSRQQNNLDCLHRFLPCYTSGQVSPSTARLVSGALAAPRSEGLQHDAGLHASANSYRTIRCRWCMPGGGFVSLRCAADGLRCVLTVPASHGECSQLSVHFDTSASNY
jgi:hypothetical protein